MCRIDKAANNIAFVCKKYYVQVLLKELSLLNIRSNTYQFVNDTLHNILQHQNNKFDSVFGLKYSEEEFKCLPCSYWLLETHKIPSGARFIIVGKKCMNKQLSEHVNQHSNYITTKWMHVIQKHVILVDQNFLGNRK